MSGDPPSDLLTLMRLTVVNVLLGNTDAHARNHAFLYGTRGPRLAPAYDLLPVAAMWPDRVTGGLALPVAGAHDPATVTRRHLLDEARSWRVPQGLPEQVIDEVTGEALAAIARADERWPMPEGALRYVKAAASRLS